MEIPQYQAQQTGINLGPVPQADIRPRDEMTRSLAPGLERIAQGETSLASGQQYQADALQRSQEQQDLTRSAIAVTGAHANLMQSLNDTADSIFNDPNGIDPNKFNDLTGNVHQQVTDATNELVSQATTDKGRAFVQTHMAALWADHYLPKALALQARAGADFALTNIDGTIQNAAWGAGNDPGSFQPLMDVAEGAINGAENLPFAQRRLMLDRAHTQIAYAAVNAQMRADPTIIAVPTRGPLARQPALQGVANGADGTAPLAAQPEIVGSPISEVAPPPDVLAQMQSLQANGVPVRWDVNTGLMTGDAAKNYQAPAPATNVVPIKPPEPPPQPPTDDEIAANMPAWKYLTPEHRQQFRNQAAVLLNQQGASALMGAKQYLTDAMTAADRGVADPNPKTQAWFTQFFGPGSREEWEYSNMQESAHVFQILAQNPNADNSAKVEELRQKLGIGGVAGPGAYRGFAMVSKLADEQAKGRLTDAGVALKNDLLNQQQVALAGNDPGQPIPKDQFTQAGRPPEDYDAYLKDLDVWKTAASAPGMSDQLLQAYEQSQRVTADTPDAIAQQRRFAMVDKVVADITRMRADDPNAFVQQTNPEVAALYPQGQQANDPAAWDKYFQANKAEQLRLTGSYTLTSKAQRQRIAAQLAQPLGPNDDATARAQQLQKQYGDNFAEVSQELQQDPKTKGALPPWFYGTVGTDQPYAQAKAAQLASLDIKQLEKDVDPARVTQANAAMLREFAPMFSSLGVTAGNETPLQGLLEVVKKGTLSDLRANANLSPDQAAKQNAAPYINMYTYFNNRGQAQSNSQYMVPNDQQPDKVAAGAGLAVNTVPKLNLPVPTDLTKKYKADEAQTQWNADVTANPVWSINRAGDGLVLSTVDRFGTPRPVMTPVGTQLGYSFDSLRNFVESQPGYGSRSPTTQADLQRQSLRNQYGVPAR